MSEAQKIALAFILAVAALWLLRQLLRQPFTYAQLVTMIPEIMREMIVKTGRYEFHSYEIARFIERKHGLRNPSIAGATMWRAFDQLVIERVLDWRDETLHKGDEEGEITRRYYRLVGPGDHYVHR